ncbi:unnamed protein product [Ostreobium quekettii]|uniref:Uncharacterized protein n=1 Tax=Ostreobium quekettii TaxID=121088 RepID=A0A8S1IXV6_9CHLO|nr:unnamed protein product [Ostreobium quekettii]|eukprot:evm.model.scf_481.2 EVM.evm.TU.scf_481.2   scf_481:23172-25956(+)
MAVEWHAPGSIGPPGSPPVKAAGSQLLEDFERLDELWDTMWSGDAVPVPSEPPTLQRRSVGLSEWSSDPSLSIRSRSDIGTSHPLNVVDSPSPAFSKSSSWSAVSGSPNGGRGLLRRMKSWMDKVQDRRRGIVYGNNGPCQLFSDWGIPPYPEDYDWNEG